MQNANSIWKMSALAGVVGLGLLGVLQVQRHLDRKAVTKTDDKVRLEDFKPLPSLSGDDSLLDNTEPEPDKSEPRRLNTKARRLDPLEEEVDLALEEFPAKKSRTQNTTSRLTQFPEAELATANGDTESTDIPLEKVSQKSRKPRAELSFDEFPSENSEPTSPTGSVNSEDSSPAELPGFDEQPIVKTKPASKPNAKQQAQSLVRLARKLMDDGLLDEARLKAEEATDLNATYGPLDDTPESVLAELDRLSANNDTTTSSNSGLQLVGGTRDESMPSLDLDEEPTFETVPAKKPSKKSAKLPVFNEDEDLLADAPPVTVNGKRREPDPPVPPADDSALELPPLPEDEDMPPAKPIRSNFKNSKQSDDRTESVPNKLKPLNAEPLDASADERHFGEGTLRADAPRGPQRPELKIEKVAPPNAALNQPMIYTIVIRNVGDSAAHTVVVEDQIPKGTSLSGTIPRAELTGKKLTWRLGSIKPGESKEIQVKVVPVAEGQIGSIATVNFQAEIASRTTVASPKLSMKLTSAPQVRLGETVLLNFQVTNNGSVDAHRVVLRNLIPENLRAPDVTERDLEFEVGTLPAGKTQSIQLPLATVRPGKAVNRAVLSTEGTSAAEQQVEINVIGQLVGLTRHGQTSWYVGRPIEFENRLTNNSLNPTTNVVVVESLPRTVEFVSATNGGRYDAQQRTVSWHLPHLDPNETESLKIRVTPKSIGSHAGSVQVTEGNRKGASTDYQFRAIGAANLGIEFSDKAEAYSKGEQFTTRLVIRNKGSGAASSVSIRLTVPPELQFVSVRGPVNHTTSGRDILFEPINEIGGQGNVHFDLTLKAISAGDSTLQVELQSDQFKKPINHEEPLVIFGSN